jgi:hypothetical protein
MSEPTEFSVAGFNADVCEPAEIRHRVLNGVPHNLSFEVTKPSSGSVRVVVADDKWEGGKFGELDRKMRGVKVNALNSQGRCTITIKEIS